MPGGQPGYPAYGRTFGAVDALTRGQLQEELRRIYQQTGITVLFVTHDIHEALKLGARVLVMDQGQVLQYGTPDESYTIRLRGVFVRQLVGKADR